jgi:transcription elongation GreA/GreB family factor
MEDKLLLLRERKEKLEKELFEAKKTRNEMDGKMQSRYDTQREEWALQCDILESQLHEVEKLIKEIGSIFLNSEQKVVAVGSTVDLMFDNNEQEKFLLLDESGGHNLEKLTTLSIKSPVGKAILGRKVDDEVIINIDDLKIVIKIMSIGRKE